MFDIPFFLYSFIRDDDLANGFIELENDEIDDMIEELSDDKCWNIDCQVLRMQKIRSGFVNEVEELQVQSPYLEDYNLDSGLMPREYINLVVFLMIRKGLIQRYNAEWIMEYDYDDSLAYIKPRRENYEKIVQQHAEYIRKHFKEMNNNLIYTSRSLHYCDDNF